MNGERAINPYESADAPDLAALTAHEQQMLKFYLKYRYTCPTLVSLVIRYLPSWGMMACTFAILLGVVFVMSGAVMTVPILVFVTGAWMRGHFAGLRPMSPRGSVLAAASADPELAGHGEHLVCQFTVASR